MKCLNNFIFLLAGIAIFNCETSLAQTPAQTFICDSISPDAPAQLIVSAYQLGVCLEEMADIDSAKKLVQILDIDAVKYFRLHDLYDSEAKLNDYKKTQAYKDNVAQLTALKKQKMDNYYYSTLTNELGKFSWAIKGYKFSMDKLSTPGGIIGAPPPPATMFYDIDLSSLPFQSSGNTDQDMILAVDPEKGMEIDRNGADVATIVLYKADKVMDKEYAYFNGGCHCNRNAKEKVVLTKNVRIIIFNVKTGDIYADQHYAKTPGK